MVTGDNPFIHFKNYIDNRVYRGLGLLFGSSQDPLSSHGKSINAQYSHPASAAATTATTTTTTTTTTTVIPSSFLSSSRLKMTENASTTTFGAEEPEQHTTTTMDEVHTWSIHSPYSPLNLQHLPQPTPRDAPRSGEAHFTFRDAFEDLLVAGSGQPLPSMRELAWKKRRESFPFWEDRGNHVTQWVGRLAAVSLWDALFRMEPGATGGSGKGEKDGDRQLYFRDDRPIGGWRRDSAWRGWEDRARRATDANHSSFDAKGVWDAAWKVGLDRDRWEGDGEADTEDELYRTSTPDSPNGAEERDSKNQRRVVQWVEGGGLKKPSTPETTTTVYGDGSKYVKTTERFERNGKTKVTTTEQRFDSAGNLTSESRETSTTRAWSGSIPGAKASFSWSWSGDTETRRKNSNENGRENMDGDDHEAGWGDRKDEKKGWFWNR
ncbi:hypothetical protein F4803DRAFT_300712 [Xylaria telfairii]|nr:hypothetical protein F4803DRAFT_300712 [Xylaria telfairii]